MKKERTKLCLLPQISGVEVAPCLLAKISGVEVTPSVTSVESSEQFWRKIRQIWRICEPCLHFESIGNYQEDMAEKLRGIILPGIPTCLCT